MLAVNTEAKKGIVVGDIEFKGSFICFKVENAKTRTNILIPTIHRKGRNCQCGNCEQQLT